MLRNAIVLCSLLVMLPSFSYQGAPPSDSAPPQRNEAGETLVSGEITDLSENSMRIRPWSPKLPRRIGIDWATETRHFRQARGKKSDLAVGELVLVAFDRQTTDIEKKKAGHVRAILRLEPVRNSATAQDVRDLGLFLLQSAIPYMSKATTSAQQRLVIDAAKAVGVVRTIDPFTIETPNGSRHFDLAGSPVVVNHAMISPEHYAKGLTVQIRATTSIATKENLTATWIVAGPEPSVSALQRRRLILRERDKGKR